MTKNLEIGDVLLEEYRLENGLRVVLNPDDSIPVVSVAVYYDVGSRNEKEGKSGFAHLFEHMMFQGSENVKKAEHFQFIMKAGGTMNGTTSSERTNYFETLPANQLPLALWLESDRMRSLAVTQENLDNQREAVKEEKRLRYDNQPYGQIFDLLISMMYKNFANAHSTIGSMEDLDDATVEDVQEFFRIYYAPNNAVMVISGSFDPETAKSLVEKYFGDIPAQTLPPAIDVDEPEEVAETYREYNDPLAPLPAFLMGWKIPKRRTKEFYALYLAGKLLYDGESSRLYQKLVKGEESVTQLFGFTDERRGPSGVMIGAIPKPGKDLDKIRKTIVDEIRDLAEEGPTASELEKLRNQLINSEVRSRQSSLSRAQSLAEYALYDGDPKVINVEIHDLLSITGDEIRQAADKYLNTENRALLDIIPGAAGNGSE
ncbi:MAG: insulinase family protein [Acidobacteria bacterium]|nr:MAG: insulinase family protein [Acidobacteriota bacterium]REK01563.1 MAG: insulinase family protein [Acidobacteriota bacterium]REK14519.1 MAG: insulinase family protein [Acidobacteriota bacterium]REK45234.1 MAG: insulinase family protein [Acidobacteriota bacterium]